MAGAGTERVANAQIVSGDSSLSIASHQRPTDAPQGWLRALARAAPDVLQGLYAIRGRAGLWRDAQTPTRQVVAAQFRSRTGQALDLETPRGFAEHLNRRKLSPASPLETRCADKLAVREHVEDRVGAAVLPELYLSSRRVADLAPRLITAPRFVVKTNHSWGGVILCSDRDAFDWTGARVRLARQLAYNGWRRHREPVYQNIKPAIIAEALIEGRGTGLDEVKIFCFGGEPELIMHIQGPDGAKTKTIYDTEWNRLPVTRRGAASAAADADRPRPLAEMLAIAKALSAPFPFCRVDLYDAASGPVFSELTFFPQGAVDVFEPPSWETRLGDLYAQALRRQAA